MKIAYKTYFEIVDIILTTGVKNQYVNEEKL